jgi:hypothetical protein
MIDTLSDAFHKPAGEEQQQLESSKAIPNVKPSEGNGSDLEQTDLPPGKAKQPERDKPKDAPWLGPKRKYPAAFGAIGFGMWMLFFSMGVLCDSSPYRIVTDSAYRQTVLSTKTDNDSARSASLIASAIRLEQEPPKFWSTIRAFFLGLSIYTPINLALLCFCAGLMGGASSRLSYELALGNSGPPSKMSVEDYSKIQLHYLRESPLSAALRSFVVYLVLLSGFYLAVGDPFKDISSSQYLRMAGIVSCIAFAIGYDPSRFADLINSLPKPTGGQQR